MNSLQRVAQLEAMLARIIVEDNRAGAMSDYRAGADFAPLRKAIAISRGAFPLGTDYYVKAGMMHPSSEGSPAMEDGAAARAAESAAP